MKVEDVRSLIKGHHGSDEREQAFCQRMLALCDRPAPFARTHYEPGHFTASAFVLSPDKTQMLLIFHSKLELWLQPGGHLEPEDPTLVEAARREVEEETGLSEVALFDPEKPILDVDIHMIPAREQEPDHEHFDVRVLFVASTWEASAGSDAKDLQWVNLAPGEDGIDGVKSDESVMRAVRKIRDLLHME